GCTTAAPTGAAPLPVEVPGRHLDTRDGPAAGEGVRQARRLRWFADGRSPRLRGRANGMGVEMVGTAIRCRPRPADAAGPARRHPSGHRARVGPHRVVTVRGTEPGRPVMAPVDPAL